MKMLHDSLILMDENGTLWMYNKDFNGYGYIHKDFLTPEEIKSAKPSTECEIKEFNGENSHD